MGETDRCRRIAQTDLLDLQEIKLVFLICRGGMGMCVIKLPVPRREAAGAGAEAQAHAGGGLGPPKMHRSHFRQCKHLGLRLGRPLLEHDPRKGFLRLVFDVPLL